MAAIKKEIEEAEAKGEIPKGLTRKLKTLEKRDKRFEKNLARITKAPELLTVKGGVLPSASWLLGALILTAGAWGLSETQNFIPITLWVLGLAVIGYSVVRIYQSLKVIESVAITSEEAALKRTIDAFKVALRDFEEEKKSELILSFRDVQPPFHMKAESEIFIEFSLELSRGDIAKNPVVYLCAPPDFAFPDSPKALPPQGEKYANYISSMAEFEDIRKGTYRIKRVKLSAPSQPKHYAVFYRLYCEGFDSGYREFEVVVE